MEYEERADELEREADKLEQHNEHVGSEIEGARKDWESKQEDQDVPGAQSDEAVRLDEDEGDPDDDAEVGEDD